MKPNIALDQHKVDVLALARLKILDVNGKEVVVSSLWKDAPAVLIFLRHFSCIACRAYVDLIWKKREEFQRSKTRIIFVGNGAPHLIGVFKADLKIADADIYTDPTLKTFEACGLVKGIFHLLDPRGVMKVVEFHLQGYRQAPLNKDSGSHTQMGGVVAFKPNGRVVYHYIENFLGDNDLSEGWKAVLNNPNASEND
jgi:hypothetical protein